MSRIAEKFRELAARGEKPLIPYFTAGFPDYATSLRLLRRAQEAGADMVEIGVPFSDPIADGPVIQHASQEALARGMTLCRVFDLCASLRNPRMVPVLLMGYYNPILQFGLEAFAHACRRTGISGLIVPDLPPEESCPLERALDGSGVDLVRLVTIATPQDRARTVTRGARGFLYLVSVSGVTGSRSALASGLQRKVRQLRTLTPLPIAVGFGISRADQVRRIAAFADGVIVGSFLMERLRRHGVDAVLRTLRTFKNSLKESP